MGSVWRADDDLLGRPVAIKILRPEFAADAAAHARVAFEARAVATIDSPGVVRVYDFGEVEFTGVFIPYIVMELVDGSSLNEVLKDQAPLSPESVLRIMRDVSDGLKEAHEHGLVHRDIKPGNILITTSGRAKVTDFGIAHGESSSDLTLAGTLVGTAKYLAPEQVEGRSATAASDVYALGIVAYEALAGHAPFQSATDLATALMRLRIDPPPLPSSIPPSLRELVSQMLAIDPEQRPPLDEVLLRTSQLEKLSSTREGSSAVSDPPTATRVLPVAKRSPNKRIWWVAGVATVAITATITTLSLVAWNGSAPPYRDNSSSTPTASAPSSNEVGAPVVSVAVPSPAQPASNGPSVPKPVKGKAKTK